MAKYLVVAHETVTNPELIDQLRAIQKDDQQRSSSCWCRPHQCGTCCGAATSTTRRWWRASGRTRHGRCSRGRASTWPVPELARRHRRTRSTTSCGTTPGTPGWSSPPCQGEVPVAADGPSARCRIPASPAGVPRAGAARVVGRRLALTAAPPSARSVEQGHRGRRVLAVLGQLLELGDVVQLGAHGDVGDPLQDDLDNHRQPVLGRQLLRASQRPPPSRAADTR